MASYTHRSFFKQLPLIAYCAKSLRGASSSSSNKDGKKAKKIPLRQPSLMPRAADKIWEEQNLAVFGRRVRRGGKMKWDLSVQDQEEEFHNLQNETERDYAPHTLYASDPSNLESTLFECDFEQYHPVDEDVEFPDEYGDSALHNERSEEPQTSTATCTGTSVPSKTVHLSQDLRELLTFPLFVPMNKSIKTLQAAYEDLPSNQIDAFEGIKSFLSEYKTPSVTHILSETMPPESVIALKNWERKQIRELGYDGFMQLKKETFLNGSNFHQCLQDRLEGKPADSIFVNKANEGHWSSIQCSLKDVSEVICMEETVIHPYLGYKGKFDCLAFINDTICIIDWKTSKKSKSHIRYTYDNPLQVAAYLGALMFDTKFDMDVENAALVIAYEDGSPADTHFIKPHQCVDYWQLWVKRLYQFWTMKTSKD